MNRTKESEEIEVKGDKEWLEDEVGKIVSEYQRENIFANFTRYMIYDIKDAINQLDEPEVLSQEWIDDNAVLGQYSDGIGYVVPTNRLQKQLVLRQELPVIPEFVAEWITAMHKGGFDLYPALKRLENNASYWEDVYNWYKKNTHDFANVYLTGNCEVEEQKYIVEIGKSIYNTTTFGQIGEVNGQKIMLSVYASDEGIIIPNKYTKQEILKVKNGMDIFKDYAVKVEELEE